MKARTEWARRTNGEIGGFFIQGATGGGGAGAGGG